MGRGKQQLGSHPVHPNQKCLRLLSSLLSKAIANHFHLNRKLFIYIYTPQEAFHALNVTLQWLESQGSDPNYYLLLVKNWRNTAARMRQETLRQTKLN